MLDASALLAQVKGEPGGRRVDAALLAGCAIGAPNWAEVLSKLADEGQDPDDVATRLRRAGILDQALFVVPFDETQARAAARMRPLTRAAGLSLGDRACLALGITLGVPVLTTDSAWAGLRLGVTVEVIR